MYRWMRDGVKSPCRRGLWLAALAILGYLWLPVLHAYHGDPQAGLVAPDLHGELCLAGDLNDPGAGPESHGPADHRVMSCECLTCKVMQAGSLSSVSLTGEPAAEMLPHPPSRLGIVHPSRPFTRPPLRAPPRG